jgi:hypothetical protein
MNETCEHCGGPRPTAKGARPRKFCSDTCRTKAYQVRKRAQAQAPLQRLFALAQRPNVTIDAFTDALADLLDAHAG